MLIDVLLLTALVLTLGLLVFCGYEGWEEQSGRYYRYERTGSHHIANITVNLGGTPKQEHCRTCHPEGRAAVGTNHSLPGRGHPNIAPHSMSDLGCTACHLGEGMAADTRYPMAEQGTKRERSWPGKTFRPVATNATN